MKIENPTKLTCEVYLGDENTKLLVSQYRNLKKISITATNSSFVLGYYRGFDNTIGMWRVKNIVKNDFKIFNGYDHFNDYPIYRVEGVNNHYVGEWDKNLYNAKIELTRLLKKENL